MSEYSTVQELIAWNRKAQDEARRVTRSGGKVLYQANANNRDYMLVLAGNVYSFRVNGISRYTSRSLVDCVEQAKAAGMLDDIEAIELTKGKRAAEKARQIERIRAMLNRR